MKTSLFARYVSHAFVQINCSMPELARKTILAGCGWFIGCGSMLCPAQTSAQAGLDYLRQVMDQFHNRFPVYDDVSSAGNHFHAFGKIPDEYATVDINGSWSASKHSGATSIRCVFTDSAGANYGGFYFQNGTLTTGQTAPQPNCGTVSQAGINLSGATALTFWARGESGGERIEFFVGGVGRNPVSGAPEAPYPDSTSRRPVFGTVTMLTTSWQKYTIDLNGLDLSYVQGGLCLDCQRCR